MRASERKNPDTSWRALTMVVAALFLVVLGIWYYRHRTVAGAPQIAVPNAVSAMPTLADISRLPGHAAVSLDDIVINGRPTVVAGLRTRRTFRVAPNDAVAFDGWAFDPTTGQPAAGAAIRFGSRDIPATYGLQRKDVATAFKVPDLALVGFHAKLNGRDLGAGANTVSLVVISSDRKSYYINPSDVVLDRR